MADKPNRLSIFPLGGALLFPRMQLPLHIFEPRYRALVSDAMARDRRIGMIQPKGGGEPPALFDIGCIGRIAQVEALEDGRYNIVLEGISRFRLVRELDVTTPFRQVEISLEGFEADSEDGLLGIAARAALETGARRFAEAQGYAVDWEAVARLDDEAFVNGVAQIAPFDIASKQALLESPDLPERAELLTQLLQFFSRHHGGEESGVTLQ
ncbi:LON peptidase substrate-binding domain-containing protein [Sphingomonas sp. C3-2]|uniref:LON peptidase substrate-binding domain-containing protein n=1 Tax=Sphingomonas sp. C3-2 TaxID=3062169 RepID=UPI00294B0FC1|nr:LON peptidase substrate-binding domain-containing protein [Sphingomonas sp. C3-2]WOK35114.1 LON peptidase substrate-binding domain-containing protein [Sphingomonas sp. C3-2]